MYCHKHLEYTGLGECKYCRAELAIDQKRSQYIENRNKEKSSSQNSTKRNARAKK